MGRFYYGDIEGKFWFGVQDSFDADNFGVEGEIEVDEEGEETNLVSYNFSEENIPDIEEGIQLCVENLGEHLEPLNKFFEECESYTYSEIKELLGVDSVDTVKELLGFYSRMELGKKILKCVKETGSCFFEGEL